MSRLSDVRHHLLAVHRALLDMQRIRYEREHGRVSSGAFLEQVIGSSSFAWLQPLTALIVALDEAVDPMTTVRGRRERAEARGATIVAPRDEATVEADYLADVRALLRPNAAGSEFQRRYAEALHDAPDVLFAHGAVMRALPAT